MDTLVEYRGVPAEVRLGVAGIRQTVRVSTNPQAQEPTTSTKPFLRWAGGKRQLLPTLFAAFPKDFSLRENRYFEPFVGGGAVLMALPNSQFWSDDNQTERKIFINDANQDLITTYELLRNQPKRLVTALGELAQDISPQRYYEIRASRPKTKTDIAARFIYLNRLCFNGLHRVNSKGEFNVPYGKLKNPKVCDESLLLAVSQVLKKAEISQGGFETAVATARKGDLVYFDPPYVPLTATASFSSYSAAGFNEGDQRRLAQVIDKLVARGVRVMLSNSSASLTRQVYQDGLSLFALRATRSISASGGSRQAVDEVLGLSYGLSDCANPAALGHLRSLKQLSL